jgi:hypothetical protein
MVFHIIKNGVILVGDDRNYIMFLNVDHPAIAFFGFVFVIGILLRYALTLIAGFSFDRCCCSCWWSCCDLICHLLFSLYSVWVSN